MEDGLNFEDMKKDLHNHTEDIVLEYIEDLLKESDKFNNVCTCQQCLLDMATYALNRLPPK